MLSNFKNKEEQTLQKEEKQYIVFVIGKEEFGVDVKQAREIITTTDFTIIPKVPQFVKGVINLRGEIIPIIDLRKKLDLAGETSADDKKVIIVELDHCLIGMQVDDVKEMIRINLDDIVEAPSIIKGIKRDYVSGVGKLQDKLLILLNLTCILSEQEMQIIDEMDLR